jgi:hypothetical protein
MQRYQDHKSELSQVMNDWENAVMQLEQWE